MKDRRSVDDLSIDELQRVLVEKKRAAREARLARFRQTGRARPAISDPSYYQSAAAPAVPAPRSLTRRVLDWALLAVEIGAVLGLIFILYNGSNILQKLNQEVAQAILQPTLTRTPLITAVVLPSGHTPPNAPGGAQPNEAEIPESLRPLVQSLPQPVIPTQGPTQAQRVVIPAINVDAPVVQGDG